MNNAGNLSHRPQSSLHAFVYFTKARDVFRTQPNIYDGELLTLFAKKLHCDVRMGSSKGYLNKPPSFTPLAFKKLQISFFQSLPEQCRNQTFLSILIL